MPLDIYLAHILSPLLKNPEKAQVVQSEDDQGVLLTITLAQGDMGTVIGKSGETIKVIRFLLKIAGIKRDQKVLVKVNEPDGTPYRPWRKERAEDLVAS